MKSYEESQSRRYQKARGFPDARGRGARAVSLVILSGATPLTCPHVPALVPAQAQGQDV